MALYSGNTARVVGRWVQKMGDKGVDLLYNNSLSQKLIHLSERKKKDINLS
jgi:hypothetical protein